MDTTQKKKPGRPKKSPVSIQLTKDGVVSKPQNYDAPDSEKFAVEILYENPSMFKKIFSIFKNMNSKCVYIRFASNEIYLSGLDHLKKNNIYIVIHGQRLNRYYCEHDLDIELSISSVKQILHELTKECSFIGFTIVKRQIHNKMTMITTNAEYGVKTFTVVNITKSEYNWDSKSNMAEDKHILSFELPFKLFKNKINTLKSYADIMTIEKNGEDHLKINALYSDKKAETVFYFEDDKKINLKSDMDADELLAISVSLEYIKPVVGTTISNTIKIMIDHYEDIKFSFFLDRDEVPSERKHVEHNNTERANVYITTEIKKNIQ